MRRRNLELKLRLPDLAAVRRACAAVAEPAGAMEQVDTYFHVPHGRLKLRESLQPSAAGEATLIAYHRPDAADVRASEYHLVPVPHAAALKYALSAALGVRGVVRKRREVLMYHNVRIHLDEVEGLGTFLELEAVISEQADEAVSGARLNELCRRLGLRPGDGIAGSYADLLGV
jgi:predicted adenylyl cyclase CyaB